MLVGCTSTEYVRVTPGSLYFNRYNYSVRFYSPPTFGFVSRAWIVDNMHREGNVWQLNDGPRYYGWYEIDRDGDGRMARERTYVCDLKLSHRRTAAVLWIQTHELGLKDTDLSLEVLLDRYVGSLSDTGVFTSGNVFAISGVKMKSYAARVVRQRGERFLGRPALTARISLVNRERLRADPSYKGDLLEVTFTKIPFPYDQHGYEEKLRGQAVLIVGYNNTAAGFDGLESDFAELKNAITLLRTWPKG